MIKHYRKKPVVVEAVHWTGDNVQEVQDFVGESATFIGSQGASRLILDTLEGSHYALIGDFIIKGVHGEFYPCKPDIFKKTYELLED